MSRRLRPTLNRVKKTLVDKVELKEVRRSDLFLAAQSIFLLWPLLNGAAFVLVPRREDEVISISYSADFCLHFFKLLAVSLASWSFLRDNFCLP